MVDLKNTFTKKYKYPENLSSDVTSSVYMFANLLGDSLGPLWGGLITYDYGFDMACIGTGVINMFFGVLFALIYRKFMYLNGEKPLEENDDETTDDEGEAKNLGYIQLELNEQKNA